MTQEQVRDRVWGCISGIQTKVMNKTWDMTQMEMWSVVKEYTRDRIMNRVDRVKQRIRDRIEEELRR